MFKKQQVTFCAKPPGGESVYHSPRPLERYNERGDFLFTTTPPDDLATQSEDEAFIPQLVDGAGYTTQTVIFAGPEGSPVSGNIYFFDQNGQPINPLVR